MISLLLILTAIVLARHVAILLAGVTATAVGAIIVWRCRVLGRQMLARRGVNPATMPWDARPSRRQRRIAARALAWSLHRTEFCSLLPQIDARAERMFVAFEAWHLAKCADRREAIVR